MISRSRSSGDGRRRYVHLVRESLDELVPGVRVAPSPALFVCTRNSARSQLAAALWRADDTRRRRLRRAPTRRTQVHPGAVAAAKRVGLDLTGAVPTTLPAAGKRPELVVTVCDQAHEELDPDRLMAALVDPRSGRHRFRAAFDATVAELRERIAALVQSGRVGVVSDPFHPTVGSSRSRPRPAPASSASTSSDASSPRRSARRC